MHWISGAILLKFFWLKSHPFMIVVLLNLFILLSASHVDWIFSYCCLMLDRLPSSRTASKEIVLYHGKHLIVFIYTRLRHILPDYTRCAVLGTYIHILHTYTQQFKSCIRYHCLNKAWNNSWGFFKMEINQDSSK